MKNKLSLLTIILFSICIVSIVQSVNTVKAASTIDDATTQPFGLMHGNKRTGFYANGLFWQFFSDGTLAGWEFSNDGVTWDDSFTSIGFADRGHLIGVWYDGIYVHYVRADRLVGNDMFYRRGVPENDGSITWSAAEQLVFNGVAGNYYHSSNIVVDSNGYAWIGATFDKVDGNDFPIIMKNANNDGTWSAEFTYELSAVDDNSWAVTPVPLTDGKMYIVYARVGSIRGRLYNAGWGAEESTLTNYGTNRGYTVSTVAYGDDVHLIYERTGTEQLRYANRTFGVGWIVNDILVVNSLSQINSPALSLNADNGNLHLFWTRITTDHIYYMNYTKAEGWIAPSTDWIDESVDDIKYEYIMSSYYQNYGGYIGVAYQTRLVAPYKVRFDFLQTTTPAGIVNIAVTPSDATPDDEQWIWLNTTVNVFLDSSLYEFTRIDIDPTGMNISISYTNGTGFTIESNPSNYVGFDDALSTKTNINGDTVRIDFYIVFRVNSTKEGVIDIGVYSTADSGSLTDSDTFVAVITLTFRTPSTPTLLYGAGFNSSIPYIELHWTHDEVITDRYEVQNSTNGSVWESLGVNASRVFTDTSVELVNGSTRYHRIRASRLTGVGWKNSSFSNVNFDTVHFLMGSISGGGLNGVWRTYNVSSITVLVGTYVSGDLISTQFVDGDSYLVTEVTGVPGWDIRYNFTDIPEDAKSLSVRQFSEYEGNPAHDIDLEVYNFTSNEWIISINMIEHPFMWNNVSLSLNGDFVDSGRVWVRNVHKSPGSAGHSFDVDYLRLRAFTGTTSPLVGGSANWILPAIFIVGIALLTLYLEGKKR